MRIALLEDDPEQAALLVLWLTDAGYECIHLDRGQAFIQDIARESHDALILDWMVPDMSGLDVLAWVRANVDWPIPVLFVTQRDTEKDVVLALESGADDYMVKPISRLELLARLQANMRRQAAVEDGESLLDFKPFVIDQADRSIRIRGEAVKLTEREYDLALFLFRNAGRVLSRGHILQRVWKHRADLNTRTVDTHVSRLRQKLNISPENGWRLISVYQHGYRLERHGKAEVAD